MNRKNSTKILCTLIAILFIIFIISIIIFLKVKNTNKITDNTTQSSQNFSNNIIIDSQINHTNNLEIGNYTVNEIKLDEAGVSNEDCGIKLQDNNQFQINMGWGVWHSGKYEIKDNFLICKSTLLEWDGGAGPGNRVTDVTFTFQIINDNLLQLSNIVINDTNTQNLIYKDGLTVGMTYSKK